MKSTKIKLFSLFFTLVLALSGTLVIASAVENTTESTVINVTAQEISQLGAVKAINNALKEATLIGTADIPCTVKVEAGNYKLDYSLKIYSNTILDLTDVTLSRKNSDYNVLHIGNPSLDFENSDNAGSANPLTDGLTGYTAYQNITINNGTLSGANLHGTILKVAHTTNFTMNNTVLTGAKDSHTAEVAAVNHFTLNNCVFKNQSLSADAKTKTYEAIQFDVTHEKHFNSYRAEALPCKNIKITGCKFSNVPRAIGSHTGIANAPIKSVSIKNCTFNKISSVAIQFQNCQKVTIANNKITNAPRGIAIYSITTDGQGTYLASTIANHGKTTTNISDEYTKPTDAGIVIKNNTITLTDAKDPHANYQRLAILVSGGKITEKKSHSDGSGNLPTGNYYITGATVSGNTITTYGHGIRVSNARNVKISSNTITCKKSPKDSANYYGIQALGASKNISVIKNTIKNPVYNGIYFREKSSATTIESNKISAAGNNAIAFESSSTDLIASNSISSPAGYGISLTQKSSIKKIKENKISKPKKAGIVVIDASKVTYISSNTISTSKSNSIHIASKSTVNTISSNTIKSSLNNGIVLYEGSKATKISSNKISSPAKHGIALEKSTATTITKNSISSAGGTAISINFKSKATDITRNSLSSPKLYGITVNESSTVTNIKSNTVSSSKNRALNVGNSSKVSTISSNTLKNCAGGIHVYQKARVTTLSSNTFTKCGSKPITSGSNGKITNKKSNKISN
ncbi:MAG: right-handed parallel beta-helix repeat-containing protein [Ruminococcaceae bacterium]|nr:right-handed parallel beta-helix repeat-containing protein [Oscillospiraceae bacterium]